MGKLEDNKKIKREAILDAAFLLFTTKGLTKTSVADITAAAGVAKGTFYLYFKDKYDIKNKLVAHKTHELFANANVDLAKAGIQGLEEQLVFIIDHVINALAGNRPLLNFISKDLVMGALQSALPTGERTDRDIYEKFLELVEQDEYQYEDVDVMLFTIVELAGSTAYSSVIYKEPLPFEEYKPFLYRTVRLIIESHRVKE